MDKIKEKTKSDNQMGCLVQTEKRHLMKFNTLC